MVLPDADAAAIYQHDDGQGASGSTSTRSADRTRQRDLRRRRRSPRRLRYGTLYEFRVRLADMSGGGPELGRAPHDETPSQVATCRFKRYVAPDTVRIDGLPANTDEILFGDTELDAEAAACSAIRPSSSPASTPTR